MLTRREEDIAIMENEEKNIELLLEWAKGKEGKRSTEATPQTSAAQRPPQEGVR